MEAQPREITRYITSDGKVPFAIWFDHLRDRRAKLKIKLRLDRVEEGNLGDYRSLGEGLFELKIDYGPGYRLYFGQIASIIVILLCGGDKSTQDRDIEKAREYGRDYYARLENSHE
jgi:putative addiction module killer protein